MLRTSVVIVEGVNVKVVIYTVGMPTEPSRSLCQHSYSDLNENRLPLLSTLLFQPVAAEIE